jgi:hypothetical protein
MVVWPSHEQVLFKLFALLGSDAVLISSSLETSVTNCHSMLRKIPEERRSHLHHGGSLKSRKAFFLSEKEKSKLLYTNKYSSKAHN